MELPVNCAAPLLAADVPEGLALDPELDPDPDPDPDPEAAAVAEAAALLPATETAPSVAPAVPEIALPEGFWPVGEVALVAIAAALKASKLFACVGLMAKTIPA